MGHPPGCQPEEATIAAIEDYVETTTHTELVETTEAESLGENKASSVNNTSFNLDYRNNHYIMSPPPIESPPPKKKSTRELPTIVVGYNLTKVGRYNLRPNPKPNANPDFRKIDSLTTEDKRQFHL